MSLLVFGCVIVNGQDCLCIKVEDTSPEAERPVSIVLDKEKGLLGKTFKKKMETETEVVPYQIDPNQKIKRLKHSSDSGIKVTYCFTNKKI